MATENGRLLYRYRLNENAGVKSKQVGGVSLSTSAWVDLSNKREDLSCFVRTKSNPEGFLDFQIYDVTSKIPAFDSKDIADREIKIYTREELSIMTRNELIELAQVYNIDPVNKTDVFLCRLILAQQSNHEPVPVQVSPANCQKCSDSPIKRPNRFA